MKKAMIISDRSKKVPLCRGANVKVDFQEVITENPDGSWDIVQTRGGCGFKVTTTRVRLYFHTIGNGDEDYPGDYEFYGFGPWGNHKYLSSKAKAIGQVKRYMQTEEWYGQAFQVLITNYTDDLVYPEHASEQYRGKPSPLRGKWFARVMFKD